MKDLYKKYKGIISYLFFGVSTTIINVSAYWSLAHFINFPVMTSTIIAWFLAVLFAYITNRKWVFHSEAKCSREIIQEIFSFFLCRFITGIIDWVCMFLFVDILGLNDIIIKFINNVIVIILNYVTSKLVIFKNKVRINIHEEK